MIEIKNVTKIYKDKEREVKAVDDVSLNRKEKSLASSAIRVPGKAR